MSKLSNLIQDLEKANASLKEAVALPATRVHKDATIQRLEFTFELCWKTLQTYVRDQGFDCKSPKSCFREAAKIDLIGNPEKWFEYLEKRNLIDHTYNEQLADQVYQKAVDFPKDVDKLLKDLKGE